MGPGWSFIAAARGGCKNKSWGVWDGLKGQLAPIHILSGEKKKWEREGGKKKNASRGMSRVLLSAQFWHSSTHFIHLETPGYPSTLWAYLHVFSSQRSKVRDGVTQLHKYLVWLRLWMDPGGVNTAAGGSSHTGEERRFFCKLIPHL